VASNDIMTPKYTTESMLASLTIESPMVRLCTIFWFYIEKILHLALQSKFVCSV